MINTAEYRYTLMKPRAVGFKGFSVYIGLELAAFGDLGLAWNEGRDFRADNFIGGYGFGLRLLVPFVDRIRIDFALGESGRGLRSQFGILEKAVKQRERVR
jgi:outer membrane protein assembly factor BamA